MKTVKLMASTNAGSLVKTTNSQNCGIFMRTSISFSDEGPGEHWHAMTP